MRNGQRWMGGLLIVLGLLLSACGTVTEEEQARGTEPAAVEPIRGTDRVRVILTAKAAERLDIRTDAVRAALGAGKVIPYAAVFYTPDGKAWAYTTPGSLAFVREAIAIAHIDGDLAYLSDGPPVGTQIVIQGAAELFGTETGVEE